VNPESEERHTEETVAELRADIDQARHEIDRTVSQIEERLSPDSLKDMVSERVQEATTPWRERPVEQAEAVFHQSMTRLREMAWLNPAALGVVAAALGYLMGRRAASR